MEKKNVLWVMIVILFLASALCGCVYNKREAPSPTISSIGEDPRRSAAPTPSDSPEVTKPPETSDIPIDGEFVGEYHISTALSCMILINNREWAYEQDNASGQIYIYDTKDATYQNMISISCYAIKGSAKSTMQNVWGQMKQSLSQAELKITKETKIAVGEEQYAGQRYDVALSYQGEEMQMNYLLWATKEKVYLCSVSAVVGNEATVEAVLQGMLESFTSFEELAS